MANPELLRAQLVLPVHDMKQARELYERVLGFETAYLHNDPIEDPEGNYAILKRDRAELHLILDEPPGPHPWTRAGTGYVFLIAREVDAILDRIKAMNVEIARGMMTESWGARAFQLKDPSGNLFLIAEDVKA